MAVVLEKILEVLLENGLYTVGQPNTTTYVQYTYCIATELKQIIININTADTKIFSGNNEFEKTCSKNTYISYLLEDFKLQLLLLGLRPPEHYTINENNHTIAINFAGYNKLLEKKSTTYEANNKEPKIKNYVDLLKGVTTIFSLTSSDLHEVAETITKIMDNKNPCFRIMPKNNDRAMYELYADGGLSEILAQQLRDSFRIGAFKVLNQPGQMPIPEKDLPDCQQAVINNALPATFNKYVSISEYLYYLLMRVSSTLKVESSRRKDKVMQRAQKKPKRRVNFGGEAEAEAEAIEAVDHDSESQKEESITSDADDKKVKLDFHKRKSLAFVARDRLSRMINSDIEGISWDILVRSGLAADMEDILPEGCEITLKNKYDICNKLETFFLNTEKINSLPMIIFLFNTLLNFKDVINIHQHETRDYFLFKKNTDSWQKLIKRIRDRAFELLVEEIGKIEDDRTAIKKLQAYRNEDIFKLHRSNAFFLKIGRTSTIKKIDDLIAERQRSYVDKSKSATMSDLSLKKS